MDAASTRRPRDEAEASPAAGAARPRRARRGDRRRARARPASSASRPAARARRGRRLRDRGARRAHAADLGPAASTHAARLSQAAGEPLAAPRGTITHLFPTAAGDRRRRPTARSPCPPAAATRCARCAAPRSTGLIELPGVGPWTQAYVNLRALRDRDAWLPTDLGVRHALARLGHDGDAERWRPYRGMRRSSCGPCSPARRCAALADRPARPHRGDAGDAEDRLLAGARDGTRTGTLVLLAGGPGQAAIPFTDSFSGCCRARGRLRHRLRRSARDRALGRAAVRLARLEDCATARGGGRS